MNCSTPGLPVHHQLPEFTQTHVHQVGDAIQPSHPLSSLLLLPPIPPSIRVFSNESALCIRWPKYWSFSFNISPSNEHPGLISFRTDWLVLLAVQGTLKSLQHHSSKASILQCSAFFTVQLSHPYMTIGKTIALTRPIFVGKVMSLLFIFSSVQSLSHVQLFATLWIAARQASLSITNSWSYSNSCPSSYWCHPAISSSVVPFSSCFFILETCKSKLQWDTSHSSEWPSSKSLQTENAGEGVEQRECSCTVGGHVNWYSHYKDSLEIP